MSDPNDPWSQFPDLDPSSANAVLPDATPFQPPGGNLPFSVQLNAQSARAFLERQPRRYVPVVSVQSPSLMSSPTSDAFRGSLNNPKQQFGMFGRGPVAPPDGGTSGPYRAAAWALQQLGSGGFDSRYAEFWPNADVTGRRQSMLRGFGSPKCNLFVYDALSNGGVAPNLINGARPAAEDWYAGRVYNYRAVDLKNEPLEVGDVVTDGHHVGINWREGYDKIGGMNVDPINGTISAAAPDTWAGMPFGRVVPNDWGHRAGTGQIDPAYKAYRWTGQ